MPICRSTPTPLLDRLHLALMGKDDGSLQAKLPQITKYSFVIHLISSSLISTSSKIFFKMRSKDPEIEDAPIRGPPNWESHNQGPQLGKLNKWRWVLRTDTSAGTCSTSSSRTQRDSSLFFCSAQTTNNLLSESLQASSSG